MPRLKRVVDGKGEFYGLRFECPGCGDTHVLPVAPGHGAQWEWNGEAPGPARCQRHTRSCREAA